MKAFVAFGYNSRDQWISKLIFDLLENLDIEIISGESMEGQYLGQGVIDRIIASDIVIAFLTKREQSINNTWNTHTWVLQEIAAANAHNKRIFAIYDEEVDKQHVAILQGKQVTYFNENRKDELIVSMVGVLQRWKKESDRKKIKLLPEKMITEMRTAFAQKKVKCFYRFMADNDELDEYQTEPIKVQGGYMIQIKNIPNRKDVLVNIRLEGPDSSQWECGYEPLDYISFNFEKV